MLHLHLFLAMTRGGRSDSDPHSTREEMKPDVMLLTGGATFEPTARRHAASRTS